MKRGILKILCAAFLLCGLLACSKDDIDTGKLRGRWHVENIDGVVTEEPEYWTFNGQGALDIRIPVAPPGSSGDSRWGEYNFSYIYQLEDDGKTLMVIEPMFGGKASWARFRIGKCTREELSITLKDIWVREDSDFGFGDKYSFRRAD